jgi:hypothetical protein
MPKKSANWKADTDAIRHILHSEWDPIGCGVPHDEYDSYIPGIYRLLQECGDVRKLAAHLEKLETISMGLPSNSPRNRRVAKSWFVQ